MAKNSSLHNILITGGSEGIGLEIAREYVNRGAKVLLLGRSAAALAAAARSLGDQAETRALDLTDEQALEAFLSELDTRGYIPDVLVNNAGHGASGAFLDADWRTLEAMFALNMRALARLSYWAGRKMRGVGQGAIVNLSAAVATRPVPWFAAYSASKAFVTNLSQALDYELRPSGVRVSVIHPPAVRTSFADAHKANLRSTLVLKLFPSVSATTVARAVVRAADCGKRSVILGPVAAIVMGTAPIMPRSLDLPFMSLLFKGRGSSAGMSAASPSTKM